MSTSATAWDSTAPLRRGPSDSAELATRAGIDERYAREWLEQQAVGGVLDVEDASGARGRRSHSPPGMTRC